MQQWCQKNQKNLSVSYVLDIAYENKCFKPSCFVNAELNHRDIVAFLQHSGVGCIPQRACLQQQLHAFHMKTSLMFIAPMIQQVNPTVGAILVIALVLSATKIRANTRFGRIQDSPLHVHLYWSVVRSIFGGTMKIPLR